MLLFVSYYDINFIRYSPIFSTGTAIISKYGINNRIIISGDYETMLNEIANSEKRRLIHAETISGLLSAAADRADLGLCVCRAE